MSQIWSLEIICTTFKQITSSYCLDFLYFKLKNNHLYLEIEKIKALQNKQINFMLR
jgi:hypothetical protein